MKIDFKISYIIQDSHSVRIKVRFFEGDWVDEFDRFEKKNILVYKRTQQIASRKYTFTNDMLKVREEDAGKDVINFESPLTYVEGDKLPSYDEMRLFLILKLKEMIGPNRTPVALQNV